MLTRKNVIGILGSKLISTSKVNFGKLIIKRDGRKK